MSKHPYISIIMSSRNDNYEGDMLGRMQTCISSLLNQIKKYNLYAEIILIEWNPPANRPFLKDVLKIPADISPAQLRIITVPNNIHQKYHTKRMNIVVTAASNIGIRRSMGDFILTTNSDILFSNELICFLSLKQLNEKYFYRADRCDINKKIIKYSKSTKLLDLCKKNIIYVHGKTKQSPHGLKKYPILHINGADFLLFSKKYWHNLHGYPELSNLGLGADALICYMCYLSGLTEKTLLSPLEVYHIDHESQWRKQNLTLQYKSFIFLKNHIYKNPHAPFFLKKLAKNIYYFKKIFFMKIEYLIYNYFSFFIKKHDFHIPYLQAKFRKTLRDMLTGKISYIYNDKNWGFPKENFKEFVFSAKNN